jgi:AraC family transcriptional regulator of adaptative response / DNA-3-methyladenine glycosylase II
LFLQHLGATPSAVAQTRRLHFAKKLIDETTLPMSEIAIAAGFGSVRRFNAGIQKVYHRTPTQIRKLSRLSIAQPDNQYLFRLRYRPPYNWELILNFLAARATPGVELVEGNTYRRTISLDGNHGYFEVSPEPNAPALAVHLQFGDPRSLFVIIERIRAMFDLNADWTAIVRGLNGDPALARRLDAVPGLRVPGSWNAFELAVRAILGQQITVKGATSLAGRIAKTYGSPYPSAYGLTHLFPSPEVLADADLTTIGLTKVRAATISGFARAIRDRRIKFEGIVDSEALLARICEIPGIGKWTAQYVAMRALGEPDAFPSGDRGLLRALNIENSQELDRRAEAWRPWRAYAAMYLWNVNDVGEHASTATKSGRNDGEPGYNDGIANLRL